MMKDKETVPLVNEPKFLGEVPHGSKFFAADVGIPTLNEDYGGGDVGANDYKDALFHKGPRGKNKPLITEDAVIKLPDMQTCERGYSEARAVAAFKAAGFKTTPWTEEEDNKLRELAALEKEGVRGRWVRISKVLHRAPNDVSTRWMQVLSPNVDNHYPDILRDSERFSGLQGKGLVDEKFNWMSVNGK